MCGLTDKTSGCTGPPVIGSADVVLLELGGTCHDGMARQVEYGVPAPLAQQIYCMLAKLQPSHDQDTKRKPR